MKMKKTRILTLLVAMFSLSGFLSAGEVLDIKGSFDAGLTGGFPVGWLPNKPSWWDDAATVGLNPIDGTEKQALQVTSPNQGIHLFYAKKWPVVPGNRCVIRAMVKGTGSGQLGVYTYPGSGMFAKTFQATEEWTAFVAEMTIPKLNPVTGDEEINAICVALVTNPNSSVEFREVTAEIVKP